MSNLTHKFSIYFPKKNRSIDILYQENNLDVPEKIEALNNYFKGKKQNEFNEEIEQQERKYNLKRQDDGNLETGIIPGYIEREERNRTTCIHYNNNVPYNFLNGACMYRITNNKIINASKLLPQGTSRAFELDPPELKKFVISYYAYQNKITALANENPSSHKFPSALTIVQPT